MSTEREEEPQFPPFWPLMFMGLSLALMLGWLVFQNVRQYVNTTRLLEQQDSLTAQAAQAEAKLQAVMLDLIKLAKTDPDAEDIVKQFGIKLTPPAGQRATEPAPSTAVPSPAP